MLAIMNGATFQDISSSLAKDEKFLRRLIIELSYSDRTEFLSNLNHILVHLLLNKQIAIYALDKLARYIKMNKSCITEEAFSDEKFAYTALNKGILKINDWNRFIPKKYRRDKTFILESLLGFLSDKNKKRPLVQNEIHYLLELIGQFVKIINDTVFDDTEFSKQFIKTIYQYLGINIKYLAYPHNISDKNLMLPKAVLKKNSSFIIKCIDELLEKSENLDNRHEDFSNYSVYDGYDDHYDPNEHSETLDDHLKSDNYNSDIEKQGEEFVKKIHREKY